MTTQDHNGLQPQWPEYTLRLARPVRLLALDVDGVMSDGSLLFSAAGDELKAFNILDGLGLKQAMSAGIEVAVITGRSSPLTERRMNSLGITTLLQGREDKLTALREIADSRGLTADQLAYVGDDLPDLAAIRYAGFGISVPNGHWYVRQHADYCTHAAGGYGAVREVTDLLLTARGSLDDQLRGWLGETS
ncbi:3-deoxy-D-manno-octulosonate 8-phosphate phosphatase (KDO 8-P phosphatase) [Marinobacter daqiaonensis]|uniref:3-deoxy-D-manno-octulosonate 8-phosphate phosphatase KdsC n=1 Tax=Marinobacter daqiaonensis TaxID=650891 RepID=A0A1I6HBH1_9GAMM|nr:HAD hydrolase family protein [Marinobacter daqiaonensis]SFR51866.1 3-deoxy-D-manno-octulosonate 8-phosphate phosphatase (KDO 8-P phosphatase) [Marinobacter daqiaonensis]